ncbi:MAG: hypothetical protein M1540_02035 [Candidatus Bathyarchaeota archaeon]|nr:hypothetical protein [Candidatus Bathyarchaeota archaeon]
MQTVHCQNYFEYSIQIREDGSALWTIKQFSGSDAPVETWEGFQSKVFDLVESAQNVTHRSMEIDETSLQIDSTISFESKMTEYSFVWTGFCIIQGSDLTFGDVFKADNFFGQLFGDAALQVTFPEGYSVKSVYPQPLGDQDTSQALKWPRTHDLGGDVEVVLTASNDDAYFEGFPFEGVLITVVVLAVAAVATASFYLLKRRKNNSKTVTATPEQSFIETEDEKVIKLLRSAGGTMRQSEITERLSFSKAKTSQLLSALETKGTLARYKKGRDKIVTLKDPVKER